MNPNGNGLGLHTSRQICIAAGGELQVISQPMIGSNFNFKMVVKKPPQIEEMGNDARVVELPAIKPGDPGKLLLK